jgi:hypothetical protein
MRHGSTRWGLAVVLVLSAAPAFAGTDDEPPLPDSRLGTRTTPLLLLSRPDVREDLKLTSDQTESARRAISSFYVKAAPLRGKPDTPETIRERRAVDDAAFGWIDSRLTPEQKVRLVQIDLQWEGPSALITRSALMRDLHLSPEQIATMKRAIHRRDALRAQGEAKADQILMEAALACLDEAQRTTWRGMLGPAFTPRLAGRADVKVVR